jgi:hypothetical protein
MPEADATHSDPSRDNAKLRMRSSPLRSIFQERPSYFSTWSRPPAIVSPEGRVPSAKTPESV